MNARRATGFTLIEMTVAIALMSLMALIMFESLRFAQRTYGKIQQTETAVAALSTSQRVLRTLLESAYPYANDGGVTGAPRNLQGGKNELTFSAPATLSGGGAGFSRYSIVLRRNPQSSAHDLIVRRWVDRNGQPAAEAAIVEETLLPNVASLDLGYLEPGALGQNFGALGSNGDQTWLDEWRERDRLPAAVRVRIKYASKDSRNLEVGPNNWPELVIAPRITDDANCEFDVVAQNCRSGQ